MIKTGPVKAIIFILIISAVTGLMQKVIALYSYIQVGIEKAAIRKVFGNSKDPFGRKHRQSIPLCPENMQMWRILLFLFSALFPIGYRRSFMKVFSQSLKKKRTYLISKRWVSVMIVLLNWCQTGAKRIEPGNQG